MGARKLRFSAELSPSASYDSTSRLDSVHGGRNRVGAAPQITQMGCPTLHVMPQ
jgi:hypothetical protein